MIRSSGEIKFNENLSTISYIWDGHLRLRKKTVCKYSQVSETACNCLEKWDRHNGIIRIQRNTEQTISRFVVSTVPTDGAKQALMVNLGFRMGTTPVFEWWIMW